jgi:serine/threonine-protein kinase HipA
MKPENQLNVWYGEVLVGRLWRGVTDRIGFDYDETWIARGFSISQQLPLSISHYSFEAGVAHQFFANLLPEAGARLHIIRDLKISNSDFELLKAIGGDCAGALSILPVDNKPQEIGSYQQLTENDLDKIILRKGYVFDFSSQKERPRLSLAGAQDKCPIFYDGVNYFLSKDAAASTHLLKFEIPGCRNVPAYEYYLSVLARSIGLPVVDTELRNHKKGHYLLIRRYDRRVISGNRVQRLHQEDFCQALGVGYDRKYQQEGGPSFTDCYHLIENVSSNPIKDLDNLVRWQLFNVLAGNSDGHAKNLALLYDEYQQTSLAPFYDLVCTRAIAGIDIKLALSVGGEFNPDRITLKHWEALANSCHLRFSYLKKIIRDVATSLLENLEPTYLTFEATYGPYPALQRIHKVITKLCNRTLAEFSS